MPNVTPNYGLKKPRQDEFYNVDVFNENADKIDAALKDLSEDIGEIDAPSKQEFNELATVVNNNAEAQATTNQTVATHLADYTQFKDEVESEFQEVGTEIDNLKSSVSSGKTLVATAITDKGIEASGGDTFSQLASKVASIKVGDYSIGNTIFERNIIRRTIAKSTASRPMYKDNLGTEFNNSADIFDCRLDKSNGRDLIVAIYPRSWVDKYAMNGTRIARAYFDSPYSVDSDFIGHTFIGEGGGARRLHRVSSGLTTLSTHSTDNSWVYDVACDPFNNFVYAIAQNGRLYRMSTNGTNFAQIADGLTPNSEYHQLAIGNDADIFVLNNTEVRKYKGTSLLMTVPTGNASGTNRGVAVDQMTGDFYVASTTILKKYNKNGILQATWTTSGYELTAVEVEHNGTVYVANNNARVFRINPDMTGVVWEFTVSNFTSIRAARVSVDANRGFMGVGMRNYWGHLSILDISTPYGMLIRG